MQKIDLFESHLANLHRVYSDRNETDLATIAEALIDVYAYTKQLEKRIIELEHPGRYNGCAA